MPIRDLSAHPSKFVTVPELAEYWAVSRQQIYKRIEAGDLEAIRLSSRLYRVRTAAALEFERRVHILTTRPAVPVAHDKANKLPDTIGVQRVGARGTEKPVYHES